MDNFIRDELVARLTHFRREIASIDRRLTELAAEFPEVESLMDIHGVGLYAALVVIGELGEIERFRSAHQVGAYAGLTSRVRQSGDHCYYGKITRQGSPWLRCVLVEAAIHVVRRDDGLRNFYQRVRKRAGSNKARVATARKLAEIWLGTTQEMEPAALDASGLDRMCGAHALNENGPGRGMAGPWSAPVT